MNTETGTAKILSVLDEDLQRLHGATLAETPSCARRAAFTARQALVSLHNRVSEIERCLRELSASKPARNADVPTPR